MPSSMSSRRCNINGNTGGGPTKCGLSPKSTAFFIGSTRWSRYAKRTTLPLMVPRKRTVRSHGINMRCACCDFPGIHYHHLDSVTQKDLIASLSTKHGVTVYRNDDHVLMSHANHARTMNMCPICEALKGSVHSHPGERGSTSECGVTSMMMSSKMEHETT